MASGKSENFSRKKNGGLRKIKTKKWERGKEFPLSHLNQKTSDFAFIVNSVQIQIVLIR